MTLPPACRAWVCDVCGPARARRLGVALDNAGYERRITVTRLAQDRRQAMARLAHLCRRVGRFEWCWSIERGPRTGMWHAHALVRSGWIENRDHGLTRMSRTAGNGFAWIAPAVAHGAVYASKLAGRYASKGASNYQAWRAWNGGKPWHWSRGYTGGVAMRSWVPLNAPAADPGPWRLVPAAEAAAVEAWRLERAAVQEAGAAEQWPAFVSAASGSWLERDRVDLLAAALDARPLGGSLNPGGSGRGRRRANAFDGWRQTEWLRRRAAWLPEPSRK